MSRTWHVRRQAQQTVRKLLSSLGGIKLANGLLEELKTVLNSHKVRGSGLFSDSVYLLLPLVVAGPFLGSLS